MAEDSPPSTHACMCKYDQPCSTLCGPGEEGREGCSLPRGLLHMRRFDQHVFRRYIC